ncbi:MAG: hypothetical protein K2Q24_07470 [Chitinophagaceae bacterium]|nr:hypothetical protein [Chitinophagaceae bacterium]
MDSIKKIEINSYNKKAYFFEPIGIGENYNFYDYIVPTYTNHLILEGGWDEKFAVLNTNEVEGLSIIDYEGIIDIGFIQNYFQNIKQLYIRCKGVLNFNCISSATRLQFFSFLCQKNESIDFKLPNTLKSFVVDWKAKYSIIELPRSIEYLCIEGGKNINWDSLLSPLEHLIKLELIKCDILNGKILFELGALRYLSLTDCKSLNFDNIFRTNNSLKYIHMIKVPLLHIEWLIHLKFIDIIIFESCGEIRSIKSLINNKTLRGVSFSGSTKIMDGDLSCLETLGLLKNCFIAPYIHYSHVSIFPWNWDNFKSETNREVVKRK